MTSLNGNLLGNLPPFSRLNARQIEEILREATTRHWQEGETVFNVGAIAERFFLLLDGTIRVVRTTADGNQVVPLHIPAGQLFGIAPAFDLTSYPATAVAASECVTLSWPARLWRIFVEDYDGFATETWKTIGERMQLLHSRIEQLATQAVEQRIAVLLLQIVGQSGRKVDDGIEIEFPITRATIAEMTGTTLHTVSRLLSQWERDGIVASTRKHITLTKPHDLVLISGAGIDPPKPR